MVDRFSLMSLNTLTNILAKFSETSKAFLKRKDIYKFCPFEIKPFLILAPVDGLDGF